VYKSLASHRLFNMATHESVPYFALSIQGRWNDSARTPPMRHMAAPGAPPRTTPRDRREWLDASPCVPYFELAVAGTLRVW
jgi:hypothetical protein